MSAEGVRIRVQVIPRASRDEIVFCDEEEPIRVRVTSAPVEGAANRSLVELFSRRLRLGKSKIRVVSGLRSKNKVVEVEGASSLQAVTEKLRGAGPEK